MSSLDAVDAIHGKRNSYGTTLFGDGARFDRGGGRQVRGPVTRWNLMDTRRSDETFLSLQALSSSHFARRRRPFSTKCVWNQQAKARFGVDVVAAARVVYVDWRRSPPVVSGVSRLAVGPVGPRRGGVARALRLDGHCTAR